MVTNIKPDANASADNIHATLPWHFLIIHYCLSIGEGIKFFLQKIPAMFFPNNPAANSRFLPLFKAGHLIFLRVLFPLVIATSWYRAWVLYVALKTFPSTKYAYYVHVLDLCVSIAIAMSWTIALVMFLTATPYLVPYLIPGIAIAFAAHCLVSFVNIISLVRKAYIASARPERFTYLQKALHAAIRLVGTALVLALTLYVGIIMQSAFNGSSSLLQTLEIISSYISRIAPIIYTTVLLSLLEIAIDSYALNKETWQHLLHLDQTLRYHFHDICRSGRALPIRLIQGLATLTIRASLLLISAPAQLLYVAGKYGYKVLSKRFNSPMIEPLPVNKNAIAHATIPSINPSIITHQHIASTCKQQDEPFLAQNISAANVKA